MNIEIRTFLKKAQEAQSAVQAVDDGIKGT